jgi:putative ABC transport system substrate-binding protein
MRRREFIALVCGAAVTRPPRARAQQKAMPVIGFLRAGQPPKSWVEAFQQGLRERGYVDGQNLVVEFRFTEGSIDQLPQLAEELVRLKVDVILASAAPAALAAKKATTSVPIVFVLTNPVVPRAPGGARRCGGRDAGRKPGRFH